MKKEILIDKVALDSAKNLKEKYDVIISKLIAEFGFFDRKFNCNKYIYRLVLMSNSNSLNYIVVVNAPSYRYYYFNLDETLPWNSVTIYSSS